MANTYSWVIGTLNAKIESDGLQNVIHTIHWRFQATDENENSSELIGTTSLGAPDADSFIEFDSLTQSDVESWIVSNEDVESMKLNLDAQLDEIATPTKVDLHLS
tara:strand:- start:1781 stop:2095 length:315 start_codon:yes stop_codon:yes gene_type:complete